MRKNVGKMISYLLILSMVFSMLMTTAIAAPADNWWEEDYWKLETLQSFGAVPPEYDASENVYKISTPEQFIFLCGNWKAADTNGDGVADAPRDGHYVLTEDLDMAPLMEKIGDMITAASGEKTEGYMSPFSAVKSENSDKTDGWFLGTFDGNYHSVSNLNIVRTQDKYTALFGYAGYDTDHAEIRNIALLNLNVEGKKSVGAIAGVSYGVIENCVVTGKISGEESVGGIAGKVKEGIESRVSNCFVYADVNGELVTGGITGKVDGGGLIENCYVGGTVSGGVDQASLGGVSGAFSAADGITNTVCVGTKFSGEEGASDIDRLVGSLVGESGVNLSNNYTWEGSVVEGNEPVEHPNRSVAENTSAAVLRSRDLYEKELGWNMTDGWTWIGDDAAGYPMVAGFVKAGNAPDMEKIIADDLVVKEAVLNINNPAVRFIPVGEAAVIQAYVVAPKGKSVDSMTVFYGKEADELDESITMTEEGDCYVAQLPMEEPGDYFYYIEAVVGGKKLTKPANIETPLPLTIDDGKIDATPRQILCQVGETYAEVGFNWLTDAGVEESTVWYRMKGDSEWQSVTGESELHYLTEGWEECQSHWATVTGLEAKEDYEYMVGSSEAKSDVHTFTTLTASNKFAFMQYGDLQAETEDGYLAFVNTMDNFVSSLAKQPDFLLNTGDIVAKGYRTSEWEGFFNMAGDYMANGLNILLPGNHENAGDLTYKQYGARTSIPNEEEYGPLEGTGWCVIGDACFVFINADPYSGVKGADVEADRAKFFAEQTEWARKVYEEADCHWRVMVAHVGTYIVNNNDPHDYPYIPEMCDELQVDLYMNGHDHQYIRTTVNNYEKTDIGAGTTFVTCSSLGDKLDAWKEDTAASKYAVVHQDGADGAKQIFSVVTFDDEGIHVTAYQREDKWEYGVIDQFDITNSLSKGAYDPNAVVVENNAVEAPQIPAGEKSSSVMPVVVIIAVWTVIAGAVIVVDKRKH